ncbi:site-specific integrase [Luteococcus sp. Sow4_B9]|uniref:site-specific integrase n=1 Tax=Luteococcus sp. Sow4_B9 TaxID=3438792 RepID=UPI003F94655C
MSQSGNRRGNGEGAVYKTGAGAWRGYADLGWKDGKRQRKYVSGRTKADVQQKVRRLMTQAEEGTVIAGRSPTLQAWLTQYLDEVASQTVRPSTLRRYRQEARLYIIPVLGKLRLDKLTPHHISDFYQLMGRRLSAGSVRRLHALLRRSLTVAVRWKLMASNPVLAVDPPSVTRQEVKPWTLEQTRAFLVFIESRPMAARWQLAVVLGLRQGETLGLSWEDIDWAGQTLRIRKALSYRPGEGLVLGEPKTARSRRTIPLPEPLVRSLKTHRAEQDQQRAEAGDEWEETGLVFTTAQGKPLHPRNDYRTFQHHLRDTGLPPIRLHDLRHTAASNMLTEGIHARVVMETLGHSTFDLTMNTYSHVAPKVSREAADTMAAALWT